MKKFIKIIIFIIIIGVLIEVAMLFSKNQIIDDDYKGMRITLVAGVALPENGGRNSNSYLIRTKNDKLIIVDGGEINDADFLLNYIMKYGNGKIDYWYITHPHADHVGALCELLNRENCNIEIENLCYYFNPLEWYQENDKRGRKTEELMYSCLESPKIINKIECQKGQIIDMDNIQCEIIRIANPEITNSDNGNESSMVFKMIDTDINKSILFLGDAYNYTSLELLEEPEKLNSYAVQMAHHGQNGVTKEVYDNINPKLCFFNAPKWLYDNDNGGGYDSGKWKSIIVRGWIEEYGADSICAFNGDQIIILTKEGYEILDENDNVITVKNDPKTIDKIDNLKPYIYEKEKTEINEEYYENNTFEDTIRLPFINIKSEDATKVNEELKEKYDEASKSLEKENDFGFSYTSMDYECKVISGKYAAISVLQMPVYVPGGDFLENYYIYNFDLENGKLLTTKDILSKFNMDENAFEEKLKEELIKRYNDYEWAEEDFGTLEEYLKNSKYDSEDIEILINNQNSLKVYCEFPVGPEGIRIGILEIEI